MLTLKTISGVLALEFNVVLLATYPYILCGDRTDFSGWNAIRLILLFVVEIGLMIGAPIFASITKSQPLFVSSLIDSVLLIVTLFAYLRNLKDCQKRNVCSVTTSGFAHELVADPKLAKRTGFVLPHRFDPVLNATREDHPTAAELAERITASGAYVITVEDYTSEIETFSKVFSGLRDELTEPMKTWTCGTIMRHDSERYMFFAFTDKNDATVFRLTYT